MMTLKALLIFCLVSVAGLAYGNETKTGMPFSDSTYLEFRNLNYSSGNDPANLIDIFLPFQHSASTKMIVFVHGGFWSKGSKSQLPKVLIELLVGQKGYAMASFNYHLVKDDANKFPIQIEDMKKVFAFLSQKGDSLGYDGKHFALLGASAGAHLALLYAYGHDTRKQISTVMDLFGPTDLTDSLVRQNNVVANVTINRFLGNSDPKARIARDASPIFFLNKNTGVPTLIIHGENDELVHIDQSIRLHKKLNDEGIKTQLITYPNEKHEISKSRMFDVFLKISKWLDEVY